MTRQNENPAGQGRGDNERLHGETPSCHAPPVSVNGPCANCAYFREHSGLKWRRAFCRLTGERITPEWSCGFWLKAEGGGHERFDS
jgi:hypothetical protein